MPTRDHGPNKVSLDVDSLFGLSYWPPIPAFLISTISADERTHVSPFSLVMFTSYTNVEEDPQTPKIITFVIGDYERFEGVSGSTTYRNIRETDEFVVNVPTLSLVKRVNRTGTPNFDKFAAANLHAEPSQMVRAPSVKECAIHFECRLEAIESRRWLGEIIHGRVVAARVWQTLADADPSQRAALLDPLFHQGYDHENGTYFAMGRIVLDEARGQ